MVYPFRQITGRWSGLNKVDVKASLVHQCKVSSSFSEFTLADAHGEGDCCLSAGAPGLWLPNVESCSGEGINAGESAW